MSQIRININNNYGNCYAPGDTITGHLTCFFKSEKKIRAINIKCIGKEKTNWQECQRKYNTLTKKYEMVYVTYSDENEFFVRQLNLLQNNNQEIQVPAGTQHYEFSFVLPHNIPSSFNGTYGDIFYSLKAVVDRPWKFDYKHEINFNVFGPINLNTIPSVQGPYVLADEKNVYTCCRKTGPISMKVTLPSKGFVPEKPFRMCTRVKNLSNTNVDNLEFIIHQYMEYKAHSPLLKIKDERNTIAKSVHSGVGAHGELDVEIEMEIFGNSFTVPNFAGATLFKVHYTFTAIAHLPCCHVDLECCTEILVGHIPIETAANINPFPANPTIGFVDSSNSVPTLPAIHMPMPVPPSAPPIEDVKNTAGLPSYEEAISAN